VYSVGQTMSVYNTEEDDFTDVGVESLRDNPNYVKCERCWNYHTCKLNFMRCCDRCCQTLLKLSDDIVPEEYKREIVTSFMVQSELMRVKGRLQDVYDVL
jgi:hypothetical protein